MTEKDRVIRRIGKQKELILDYARKLIDAGMTVDGAAVNAAFMAMAVVLEHTTIEGRERIVEEALVTLTAALIKYQKKMESALDLDAIREASKEMNDALESTYDDED